MYWQDAVRLSPVHKAYRRLKSHNRLVIMERDGKAIVQLHNSPDFRKAYPEEVYGFLDWQPAKEMQE